MKRSSVDDLELSSDDEVWTKHDFRPSRILKTENDVMQDLTSDDEFSVDGRGRKAKSLSSSTVATLPPIESFAYSVNGRAATKESSRYSYGVGGGGGSNSKFIEIIDTSSSEENVENLDDDDDDAVLAETTSKKNYSLRSSRGRRFVVDDDDDEEDEEIDTKGEDSDDIFEEEMEDVGNEEEDDVIKKALRNCGKISVELKRELYGSTGGASCSSYSEVEESSSVRIVTQVSTFLSLKRFSMLISSVMLNSVKFIKI